MDRWMDGIVNKKLHIFVCVDNLPGLFVLGEEGLFNGPHTIGGVVAKNMYRLPI